MVRFSRRTGLQLMLLGAYRGSIAANAALIAEYITTPEAHGWSPGNTVEQNTAAFNAACADASANAGSSSTGRGVVELVQAKTYVVRQTGNGSRSNGLGAIDIGPSRPNLEIRTQGRPTAQASKAIIQVESWAGQTAVHNRNVITFDEASNCRLGWVILDGNKFTIGSLSDITYNQGSNGGLSGLQVLGSTNIQFDHVESRNNLTDGIELDQAGIDGNGDNVDLRFNDCWFHHNRRQGCNINRARMTVPDFDNIVFTRCRFSHQGDDGSLGGERPGAGVDLESSSSGDQITGITFIDCEFDNQQGASFINGTNVGHGSGRGIVGDLTGEPDNCGWIKIIGGSSHDNNSHACWWNLRGSSPGWQKLRIENFVMTPGNSFNGIVHGCSGSSSGHFVDCIYTNCNASAILFNPNSGSNIYPDTGHSVTIWNGDFDPTVATNGKATITINNGFPS